MIYNLCYASIYLYILAYCQYWVPVALMCVYVTECGSYWVPVALMCVYVTESGSIEFLWHWCVCTWQRVAVSSSCSTDVCVRDREWQYRVPAALMCVYVTECGSTGMEFLQHWCVCTWQSVAVPVLSSCSTDVCVRDRVWQYRYWVPVALMCVYVTECGSIEFLQHWCVCMWQSGSIEFLSSQSLDFNKVFRDGQLTSLAHFNQHL